MNEEKNVNEQPQNSEIKIEFVPAKPKSSTGSNNTSANPSPSVPRRRYTPAKRDFSQLPNRQNGGQRTDAPQPTPKNDPTAPTEEVKTTDKRQSRKEAGGSKGKIVFWALLIAALVAGIVIVVVFATGNRQITESFKDGDVEYAVSFLGNLDENGNILQGTLKFSDNSSAEIRAYNGVYVINYSNGATYQGGFDHMHRNGHGVYTMSNGDKYTGNFHYDRMWGEGIYEYANGDKYEGSFKNNLKSGTGKYTFRNGDVYVGEFDNDMRNGKGVYTYADGSVYEGKYVDNKRNDDNASMTIKYSDGSYDVYVGSFVNDSREGHGSYTWSNGDSYVGSFTANNMNGEGTYTWASGRSYTGTFIMGSIVKDPAVYPNA